MAAGREAGMSTMTLRALSAALALSISQAALAQSPPPSPPAPQQQSSTDQSQLLSAGQLDALVAPVALYPDELLSEVLMASTYPLEVIEADRWAQANKKLTGDALTTAVGQQSWDDSVKSLVATPSVLDMMSSKLDWTQALGNAVLAQQPDVMDAIQRLRAQAQANNKLASNQQQTVATQSQDGKQVIVIAPTQPDTVYVPYYDPSVVYGPWQYPAYPPYYWPPPAYIGAGIIGAGIAFGAGYALGRWASGGYWGGGVNWGGNNITINNNRNINNINRGNGGGNWAHNPAHRQGVRYNNPNVAAKFGGNRNAISGGAANRMDFRGRGGNQVLQPGAGNRPGAGGGGNKPSVGGGGNRPGAGGGNKPGAGGGGGNRPGAGGGNKPGAGGGGNRPGAGAGGNRPSVGGGGGGRTPGGAFGNTGSGRAANIQSGRGRASLGGGGGGARGGGGGGARGGGGGGRGGGGGGGGGRGGGGGGGRRSDMRLKHDIVLLGTLGDGVGFYRFIYDGGSKAYVGVMAQEVQSVMPAAVAYGRDGYWRVYYGEIGLKFQTYDEWLALGAHLPKTIELHKQARAS
jgi:Protein of unknown function (DUF3300)